MSTPIRFSPLVSILTLVTTVCLIAGCSSQNGDPWAHHTQGLPFVMGYAQGQARSQADNKPAMYFVTTTWCGWCKKLADENFNDPAVRDLLDQFTLVIVDGDAEQEAAQQLGAEGFPHIVFKDPSGQTIGVVEGYKPVSDFKPIVEQVLEASRS